jgi:polyisoprenoid-binding protein YceI
MKFIMPMISAAIIAASAPAPAEIAMPGAPDISRVLAGTYQADPHHTQVVWTLNHMGFAPLSGMFGAAAGTLDINPALPNSAKVSVSFNIADMSTTAAPFTKHLSSADFFDVTRYPTATFISTSVETVGDHATITGKLTIKGITQTVKLAASFYGAGTHPMNKKVVIGFVATAKLKRSDFGLGFGAPIVGDDVDLQIQAAFERAS